MKYKYQAQPAKTENTTEPDYSDNCCDEIINDEGKQAQEAAELVNLKKEAEEKVCPSCDLMAQAQEERLRNLAEMDNFKKRLLREQKEHARFVSDSILADILPALDNMDLALKYGSESKDKQLLMGVEMTYKMLIDNLKKYGLEQIGKEGDTFDPLIHEAVGQEKVANTPAGVVVTLLQKGYTLNTRLLRAARVTVSA